MATIKPFRGVRYNPEKIPDLSTVISQPHDRVRHGLQDEYHNLSPYNITRIIKGKERPDDDEEENTYTRARDIYHSWLRDGILMREEAPALYVLQQQFTLPDGSKKSRLSLIAALELCHYDEGIVLPHERTLSQSMHDRFNLLRATETNFGCVFMLYPEGGINELLEPVVEQPPAFEAREFFEDDVLQRFWVVTDPDVIAAVTDVMAAKKGLVIADGHHRYETALRHRDEMRAAYPTAPPNAGFNYRLVSLVSMDDPGLVILPTHRLIHSYGKMSGMDALEKAKDYFEVKRMSGPTEVKKAMSKLDPSSIRFGFHDGTSAVLKLRDPAIMENLLPGRSPDWRLLDVAVVHELFVERVLGIDKKAVEDEIHIEFLRDPDRGYRAVREGEAEYMLHMDPTRIEQVRACTGAGERMPQKSTDFYPKMVSGLVALPVSAGERL